MNFEMYKLDRDNCGKAQEIPAFSQTCIYDILKVTAGTNGIQGGDSSHGGKTFIKFKMTGGDMSISVNGKPFADTEDVVISFGGDWELIALVDALKFAVESITTINAIKSSD